MRPVHKADNLTTICAVVTKSGNLNYLEPSGLIQACNGIVLPLIYVVVIRRGTPRGAVGFQPLPNATKMGGGEREYHFVFYFC
jgi:hypothetical protein